MKRLIADFRETMMPPVFLGSAGVIIVFVVYGALFSAHAEGTFELVQTFIIETFGWFYILSATALLVFAIWLACSRFGSIRLGGEDATPEFGG